MPRPIGSHAPELALPVAALAALRRTLEAEAGPDAAARALGRAGHAAGDALAPLVLEDGAQPASLDAFFRRLSDLFAARGWGRLSHEAVHPGVGALDSGDWVEAVPADGESRPSCFFTTGMLSALLGRAAGQSVGVLEAECRSRGDLRCRFLFGGRDALREVYAALAEGEDAERALGRLG